MKIITFGEMNEDGTTTEKTWTLSDDGTIKEEERTFTEEEDILEELNDIEKTLKNAAGDKYLNNIMSEATALMQYIMDVVAEDKGENNKEALELIQKNMKTITKICREKSKRASKCKGCLFNLAINKKSSGACKWRDVKPKYWDKILKNEAKNGDLREFWDETFKMWDKIGGKRTC